MRYVWVVICIGNSQLAMDSQQIDQKNKLMALTKSEDLYFFRAPADVNNMIADFAVRQQRYEEDLAELTRYIETHGTDTLLVFGLDYLDNSPLALDYFRTVWRGSYFNAHQTDPLYRLFDAVLRQDRAHVPLLASQCGSGIDRRIGYHTALEVAFHFEDSCMVQPLIQARASIESVWGNLTLLAWAAHYGRERVVLRMIQAGADVQARDLNRRTPLHHAAKLASASLVQLLLEHGAKACAIDDKNQWPLHKAIKCNNSAVVHYLLTYHTLESYILRSIFKWAIEKASSSRAALAELVTAGVAVDYRPPRTGQTLLYKAVLVKNEKTIRILLILGADPCITDNKNESPYDLARRLNLTEIILLFDQAIEMRQLGIDLSKIF